MTDIRVNAAKVMNTGISQSPTMALRENLSNSPTAASSVLYRLRTLNAFRTSDLFSTRTAQMLKGMLSIASAVRGSSPNTAPAMDRPGDRKPRMFHATNVTIAPTATPAGKKGVVSS
ncbi:MAG: hypothetical protein P8K08_21520 [Fuerstiella sp.]|nr:hypothetical protein [Fuerstiella sp.]